MSQSQVSAAQGHPLLDGLDHSPLLHGLPREQLDAVLDVATVQRFAAGEVVVREGDPASAFYLVVEGEVGVYKSTPTTDELVRVATLEPGSHFGETSLYEAGTRTATVRADAPATLLVVDAIAVRARPEAPTWLVGFLLNLVAESCSRLDVRSERLVKSLAAELEGTKLRLETNRLLIYVIVLMSIYSVGLAFSKALETTAFVAKLTNTGLFLVFGAVMFALVRGSSRSLGFFGVRRPERWLPELGEALAATAGFLAALVAAKLVLISTVPALADIPLLDLSTFDSQKLALMTAYIVLVPIQEMCIRGVLQGSFADFFRDEAGATWKAILLSNAIFAAVHAHMSPYFALGVFLPGLFWGWLYARQTSIVGVALSHAVIGVFAIDVLGLKAVLM